MTHARAHVSVAAARGASAVRAARGDPGGGGNEGVCLRVLGGRGVLGGRLALPEREGTAEGHGN